VPPGPTDEVNNTSQERVSHFDRESAHDQFETVVPSYLQRAIRGIAIRMIRMIRWKRPRQGFPRSQR
jgi:hypothetical protein